jgi:simple sugar transport system permease protein
VSTSVSTSEVPPAVRAKDDRVKTRSLASRMLSRPEIGSLIGAVAVFVLFCVVAPTFRTAPSLATVAYSASTIGIMAVAVALLMIGGEFDLSAGVVVTTSALAASTFAYQLRLNLWVGILVSLLLALAIGAFNGWLLMRTGLPSFLITLGTFFMLQGLNLGVTKLLTGGVSSDSVADMDGFSSAQQVFASTIRIGGVGVKITVFWWILFVAIATWTLLRTRVGNWIFAVGGDDKAARAVGVPVRRTKIGLFMTVGFAGWFVGMHQLFSFDSIQSGGGVGQEFIYIIAAVVGGCLLTGGYGSAVGSAIGALIFGMTSLGIVYAGWDANWFKLFLGVMLLLATIVNLVVKNQAAKR